MTFHYLDTSAAVPVFVREPATERMRAFLERLPDDAIAISPWVITEFASALANRRRTGAVDLELQAKALSQWREFTMGVRTFDITGRDFEIAARFCERHDLGLRAGDALHLAVAAAHGCTLVTLDERLATAAPEVGVLVAAI